jgi:hypothetical protein
MKFHIVDLLCVGILVAYSSLFSHIDIRCVSLYGGCIFRNQIAYKQLGVLWKQIWEVLGKNPHMSWIVFFLDAIWVVARRFLIFGKIFLLLIAFIFIILPMVCRLKHCSPNSE